MSEIIERPWEDFYCDKCTHLAPKNMCLVYKLGMSYVYCPHVRNCEKFKEDKYNDRTRTNNRTPENT